MKNQNIESAGAVGELTQKMSKLENEFRHFMAGLKYVHDFSDAESDDRLSTFSPLDVISTFEHRGLQRVAEVSPEEMMNNENGLKKLLANMLHQCRPDALSSEDVDQLAGINGREVRASLMGN